jgi:coenzyme PQQ precursor peptide PqqA
MGPSKAPAWVLRKGLRPSRIPPGHPSQPKESFMNWSQPAFEDIRFGFEITMYISNR